jgi:hypothetical protein
VLEGDIERINFCSFESTKKFWVDEKTIRAAFYKYRSVSHLWAACSLLINQEIRSSIGALENLDINIFVEKIIEDLGLFLAVSENMRRFGEGHVLPRRKNTETLLDPATTWRAPLGVPLPDISVTVPPLAPAALKDLHSYRARVRSM